MTEIQEVRWGKYNNYEGPWLPGKEKYKLPSRPTDAEKIMAVITATEGGCYDAVNMYDACLWTAGIIQWCNRAPQFSVDGLMGKVFELDSALLRPITSLAHERGYYFDRREGEHRFISDAVVSTIPRQRDLYFKGVSGEKGSWTEEAKAWARRWCLATSQVLSQEQAKMAQVAYTIPKLNSFAFGAGWELLKRAPATPVGYAWRAMYLSFAANNPSRAAKAATAAQKATAGVTPEWSADWLTTMAKHLTFDSGISIYPDRYNKIRPVIESLWGVDLPDTAADVAKLSSTGVAARWMDPLEVQRALAALGYDLGPAGADGKFGRKSRAALHAFEVMTTIPLEFQDGSPDKYTLPELERALERAGIAELS